MEQTHVVVERAEVDLATGNAIAISYAWGDYNRSKILLGHHTDGQAATMELGREWKPSDLIQTLADICKEAQFCWLDQFSISQSDPDIIRATLAAIPDIYHTFDVVALLPGGLCECHAELSRMESASRMDPTIWDGTSNAPGPSSAETVHAIGEIIEQHTNQKEELVNPTYCPNNLAFGPYFSRLWTRQEFLYARKVTVQWTKPGLYPCPRKYLSINVPSAQASTNSNSFLPGFLSGPRFPINMLCPAVECFFQDVVQEFIQSSIKGLETNVHSLFPRTMRELNDQAMMANREMGWVLAERSDLLHEDKKMPSGSQLLTGQLLQSHAEKNDSTTLLLTRFQRQLCTLRRSRRSTSKMQDYVLAVWVDCPGYVVPIDYKTRSLSNLLEDAIRQMEENHGCSIPVSMTAGLLGSRTFTSAWRPNLYLDEVHVETASDVYGIVKRLLYPCKLDSDGHQKVYLPSPYSPSTFLKDNPEIAADPGLMFLVTMAEAADAWGAKSIEDRLRVIGEIPPDAMLQYVVQASLNRKLASHDAPRSYTVSDYGQVLSDAHSADVFEFLANIIMTWNSTAIQEILTRPAVYSQFFVALKNRIRYELHFGKRSSANQTGMLVHRDLMRKLDPYFPDVPRSRPTRPADIEINHHEVSLCVACLALAIPVKTAWRFGLRLMVDFGGDPSVCCPSPARLGLASTDLGIQNTDTHTIGGHINDDANTDDMNMGRETNHPLTSLFEAVEIDGAGSHVPSQGVQQQQSQPQSKREGKMPVQDRRFRVVGTWVPPARFPQGSMTTILGSDGKSEGMAYII